MLRIRFFRAGRKKKPFYKIVVTDKEKPPKSGRFVEDVGFYDPITKDCKIEGERVKHWIGKGASPSDTVHNLLVRKGVIIGKKIAVHSKGEPKEEVKEEIKKEAKEEVKEETKEEAKEENPQVEEKPVEKEEKTEEPEEKTEPQEANEPEEEQDAKEKTQE